MSDVLVAALAGVACAVAGLFVPRLIARLAEPPPDPELAALEAKAVATGLTASEQRRLAEGPKTPYVDIAASPTLASTASVVSAVAGALVGLAVGWHRDLAMLLPLVPVGVLLSVVDLRTRLLPSRVVVAATVGVVGYTVAVWLVAGDHEALVRGLVGLAGAFAVFFLLWFIYPPGMGYGDVRLAGLVGLVLAYRGWAEFGVGMYAGFVLFAVPGVLVALVRRDRSLLKHAYPFGPFLLAGAVVGLLVGDTLAARLVTG